MRTLYPALFESFQRSRESFECSIEESHSIVEMSEVCFGE